MKLRCIVKNGWWCKRNFLSWLLPLKKMKGPVNGDIVTVSGEKWMDGNLYYGLREWPNCGYYLSDDFEPIEEQFEEVTYSKIKEKASAN